MNVLTQSFLDPTLVLARGAFVVILVKSQSFSVLSVEADTIVLESTNRIKETAF